MTSASGDLMTATGPEETAGTGATPDAPVGAGTSRLDVVLVRRGLARSRGQARDLITQGRVRVAGRTAQRPAQSVPDGLDIDVCGDETGRTWVSRAADKLIAALDRWPIPVDGARCLDAGASTGGFTQVLLSRGAASVLALDVGHGQLHPDLRMDPRVVDLSGTNIREVVPETLGAPYDVLTADLSFISLRLVLPVLAALIHPQGHGILLVKPQFEVGRERLGKNGLVRDPADRARILREVVDAVVAVNLTPRDVCHSPVRGAAGNQEYLLWVCPGPARDEDPPVTAAHIDRLVGEEHA